MPHCNFSGDRIFDEVDAWPISLAAVYFLTQYVTRNFWATLIFVYLLQSFSYGVSWMYRDLKASDDRTSLWFADNVFAWVASPPTAHLCSDSLAVSLVAAPLVGALAAGLWCAGVEFILGVHYKTPPWPLQYVVLWLTFLAALGLSTRTTFGRRADVMVHADTNALDADTDYGLLIASLFCVFLVSLIPYQASQTYGATSMEFARSLRAYAIFVLFYLFIVFFSSLSKSLLFACGMEDGAGAFSPNSSYSRSLLSLLVLWLACLIMGATKACYMLLNRCCGYCCGARAADADDGSAFRWY